MKTKLIVAFFLLVFVMPFALRAEEASTVSATQVGTYDQLVAAIRKARAASQGRVEEAVRQEKVRECWETGKLIDEHVLQHKERADYGKQVILRLSQDLSISDSELYYMLEFARVYPISQPAGKLSWSHYVELLSLNDVKEQGAVADMAEKGNWTRDQVREEVKKRKAAKNEALAPAPVEEKLTAKLGKPGTYKMVQMPGNGERGTEDNRAGNVERDTGNEKGENSGKGERGTEEKKAGNVERDSL